MLSAQRAGEEESPREKFTRSIQASKGLESMLGFAKSKGLVKEEGKTLPQVDLGDIRDDYAVEEGDLEEGKMKDVIIDAQQSSKEEFDAQYKGEFDYDEILADYPIEEAEGSLEDKLKTEIAGLQRTIDNYKGQMAELEADPEFQQADDDDKDDYIYNATDGVEIRDQQDKLEFFKLTLQDHLESGTTHWWQSDHGLYLDTAVRDEIADELSDMGAWQGDLEDGDGAETGPALNTRDSGQNEELNDLRKRAGLELEGNAYSGAVAKAKMNGKKKGDEIDGPDGEKIKLEKEESLEDKLKTAITSLSSSMKDYRTSMAQLSSDPEFQQADDDSKEDYIYNATDGVDIGDQQSKLEYFQSALADHLENGTTHWWQSTFNDMDTAVRDDIAQDLRDMGAWKGDIEEAQEESFDPAMEPSHYDSEFERIYTAYENGGEPELAEYLGMSDSELDQEMTEYAMDHNLHMDDDRDDVIQGYIEQLIDNADHKDMGAQMAQYESQLVQLKKLAGI